jgi:hypothetical protein
MPYVYRGRRLELYGRHWWMQNHPADVALAAARSLGAVHKGRERQKPLSQNPISRAWVAWFAWRAPTPRLP